MKTQIDVLEGRIYTDEFTIYGIIYAPPSVGLTEHLNRDRIFMPVTSAMLYERSHLNPPDLKKFLGAHAFISLPKASIRLGDRG